MPNYGTLATWIIGIAIAGATLWFKRKDWFPDLFSGTKKTRRTTATPGDEESTPESGRFAWLDKWWKKTRENGPSNGLWLTLGWSMIVIVVGILIGNWWWSKVFSPLGIALIVGWAIYGSMAKPGEPFRWKLAMIGIWLLVGVAGWHLFGDQIKNSATGIATKQAIREITMSVIPGARANSLSSPRKLSPIQEANKVIVEQFWRSHLTPEQDPELMIRICGLESGFRQFEDGTTDVPLRGKVNPLDTGICQINKKYWLSQAQGLGYNIDTLEGNLQMSLWIRLHSGPDEWNTYTMAMNGGTTSFPSTHRFGQITLTVPPDPDWSEMIYTPGKGGWTTKCAMIKVWVNKGYPDERIVTPDNDDPGGTLALGDGIKNLSFQSRDKTACSLTNYYDR